MKTKLLMAAMMLLFGLGANKALAVAGWVGNGAINVNETWYYANEELNWCAGAFSQHDFGTISSLSLGGQVQLWDENSADWGQGTAYMNYSIDDGPAQQIDLTYYKFENNNNYFQSGGSYFTSTAIDISGLADGVHTLTVNFVDFDGLKATTAVTATFTTHREPYAVLNNGTLTFYYDENKSSATGTVYDIPWDYGDYTPPGWCNIVNGNTSITAVAFDQSFRNYRLESAYYMFMGLSELESIENIEYFNTSSVTNMLYMFNGCSSLTYLDLSSFNTQNVEAMWAMFQDCNALEALNLTSFNTANVYDMETMFSGCSSLTTIYCNEDWSKKTNLQYDYNMFLGCENLVGGYGTTCDGVNNIDATYAHPDEGPSNPGYFTPTKAKEAYAVLDGGNLTFYYNWSRPDNSSYDFSWTGENSWKTAQFTTVTFDASFQNYDALTSTADMFSGLTALTTINNLTYLNKSNVTDMSNMFNGCSALTTIYCNNDWSGQSATSTNMFAGCTSLVGGNGTTCDGVNNIDATYARLDADGTPGYFTAQKDAYAVLNNGTLTFYYDTNKSNHTTDIVYDIPWDPSNEGDMPPGWLQDEANATISSVEFDPSFKDYELQSASGMFYGCSNLTEIDLTNFNSSGLVCTIAMFGGCSSLTTIYCNDDWSQIESLQYSDGMFWGCTNLVGGNGTVCDGENNIDVTYANPTTGYFTTIGPLEAYAVQNYYELEFHYDRNRSSVSDKFPTYDLPWTSEQPEWTSNTVNNVVFMDGFQNYDGLTTTANMFNGMSELNTVEGLTYLNTSNVTDMSNMFSGCSALTTIYCNNDWSGLSATSTNMFAGCTNLEGVIKYYTNLDTEHKDDITYASPITGYFTPEGEPYAVLENGTLTFRFDKNRTEDAYLIPWIHADQNINYPGWHDDNFTERSITKVIFDESFRLYKLESAEQMFSGMETLTSIEGLEYFNTASINCMEGMFGGCISLESLDLRTFNTSNVVNMSMMFSNCTSLKYVDLSSFDVTNVTNMWAMFEECDALESLDLSNFNTTSVTNISRMFENCNNLRSIDLSSFTTINVVDIFNMFRGCTILNRIYCNEDWTSIDHSDVYFDVEGMFYECENLPLATGNGFENCKPKEDGGYFIKREAYALVSDGNLTFYNNEYRPTGVDVYNVERDGEGSWKTANFSTVTFDESFKTYRLTSTANMFSGMTGLTTIYDMNNLNVMSVTDMSSMFEGCLSLTTIYCNNDWSEMDVISTDMFTGSGVSEGGNENVAYAKPENGGYFTAYNAPYATLSANGTLTFTYSTKPTDGVVHDVVRTGFYPTWRPEIQIQEPTNAPGRGLKKATTTSITKVVFDPSFAEYDGLKSTADMFYNMYDLTTIEGLEYLNTDNVTDMSEMFALCTSLTDLSFPKNFNTSEVTDMREMFTNCVSIQTLDLTEFNTTNVMDMRKMFYNCNNMTTIYCEDDWSTNENINFYYNSSYNMFKDCTSLVGGSGSSYLSWLSNTVEYANPTNGYFTALPSITLYNNSSNAETINVNNGRKVNVTLSGRTLYKDGSWNTLCLPFDVTIEGSVLVDATVKTLESASFADNTLTLNFSEGNLAVMEAGKPYIIKWEGANISTTNLVDPKFNNVTVVSANPTVVTTTDAGGTNWVDFRGIYEPWVINATNNEVLYLGGNNTLYYPKPSASGMTIGAFRAVFDLKNGLVAGDPNSASGIRAYNVNFGDEGNGITQVVSDESQVSDWYTIDGRRLLEEPTQKGIYIKGGRKVMIK